MKVGLIGNMNNMQFALARLLRRAGVDAELLLFEDEFAMFHPSADSYDLDYMEFTRVLQWGSGRRFLMTSSRTIRKDLEPYEALIGCGLSPAYCFKAGRTLDVFVPYGGDIFVEPTFRLVRPDTIPSVWAAAAAQRRGIRAARVVHMPYTNDIYEDRLASLRSAATSRWTFGYPMVDPVTYDPSTLPANFDRTHWHHEFKRVRETSELMIMSTARHTWGGVALEQHQKGTESLVGALRSVVQRHPSLRVRLVTLEYGPHVQRSKEVIRSMGLSDHVAWFPQMARKDLMVGLWMADLVCGEFEIGWFESGTRYEALVSAKPLIAYRNDAFYSPRYPSMYPIMNARRAGEVADCVDRYLARPDECKAEAARGRRWYEEFIARASVTTYVDDLQASRGQQSARRPAPADARQGAHRWSWTPRRQARLG